MSQESIKAKRQSLDAEKRDIESSYSAGLANVNQKIADLMAECKHPNAVKSYGERIFDDCPDCGWEDMY